MNGKSIKSKYAGVLNALSEMGASFAYKLRWSTILEAEHTILKLERELLAKTAEAERLREALLTISIKANAAFSINNVAKEIGLVAHAALAATHQEGKP